LTDVGSARKRNVVSERSGMESETEEEAGAELAVMADRANPAKEVDESK
jgi:hypothetical protein